MIEKAIKKLSKERKEFKGGRKETAMVSAVYNTLVNFCKQDSEFAQAIVQSEKTLTACLTSVAKGIGESISDMEAYKRAVRFYFPGADIKCTMAIDLVGAAASDTPPIKMITSAEPPKKSVLNMSLDDLF